MFIENRFQSANIIQRGGVYDNLYALGIDFLSISRESKRTDFRGSLEVKWRGRKSPYEIPCNLGIRMDRCSEEIIVDLIYSPQVCSIPDFLSEFIPAIFTRKLCYNSRGAILRETFPCLGLGSLKRTKIEYKGCFPEDVIHEQINYLDQPNRWTTPIVEEGSFVSPLQVIKSKALRKLSFDGGFDEMARKVLGTVFVWIAVNQERRRAQQSKESLFILDKFFVNLSQGEMYSVETLFPGGPWWLFDIRAKFHLD